MGFREEWAVVLRVYKDAFLVSMIYHSHLDLVQRRERTSAENTVLYRSSCCERTGDECSNAPTACN